MLLTALAEGRLVMFRSTYGGQLLLAAHLVKVSRNLLVRCDAAQLELTFGFNEHCLYLMECGAWGRRR